MVSSCLKCRAERLPFWHDKSTAQDSGTLQIASEGRTANPRPRFPSTLSCGINYENKNEKCRFLRAFRIRAGKPSHHLELVIGLALFSVVIVSHGGSLL